MERQISPCLRALDSVRSVQAPAGICRNDVIALGIRREGMTQVCPLQLSNNAHLTNCISARAYLSR